MGFWKRKNNLEPYTDLILTEQDAQGNIGNVEYVGMHFELTWDSLESIFFCCEGAMNEVKGKAPSIVKLQLLDQP